MFRDREWGGSSTGYSMYLCKCSTTFHAILDIILTHFVLDMTVSGREGRKEPCGQ